MTTQDAVNITSILKEEKDSCTNSITSFSLSYNDQLSDKGIISIMNHLPFTVKEIGLVSCNMTDLAGKAVLEWIKNATSLQMVCIEQNNFSNSIKLEFANYKKSNPKVTIIY